MQTKKLFVKSGGNGKVFPISRRVLSEKMSTIPPFWPKVLHTCHLDLSQFAEKLPSKTSTIAFKFVDPVWAWIMAARRQHPLEMHWKAFAQQRGHEVYGGGIQYGRLMQKVCADIEEGSYPMLVGLHWDGTGAKGVSSAPICVCVGNTNSCNSSAHFCVGHMPHIPDERKPEFNKLPISTEIKFYIRQRCCAAILRVLAESSRRGVVVRLLNQRNKDVVRLLHPRLSSMNLDQPEAQLFFGLQNKTACSKCRRRKGYSSFRRGSQQPGDEIRCLYTWANTPNSPHRQTSQKTLKRWGFNYKRKCCLLRDRGKLFVKLSAANELYPCLDYRDRMHAGVMFLHRVLFQTLDTIFTKASHRRTLDDRLAAVGRRGFRHMSGTVCRKQRSVFTDVGMTATDKLCVILLLSHVIGQGDDAELWPEGCYLPFATAVAHAQLVLVALHGRRSYNVAELKIIFDRGYLMIFGSLETIHQLHSEKCTRLALERNQPPPKRFKPESRT